MDLTVVVYVNGSDKAIELYQKVFDAELVNTLPSNEDDCKYYTAELNINGNSLTVIEAKHVIKFDGSQSKEAVRVYSKEERFAGNTMQLTVCFNKGSAEKIKQAYELLRGDITISELGPCFSSSCMVDFIDKFGVRWCFMELED